MTKELPARVGGGQASADASSKGYSESSHALLYYY